ATNLTKLAGIGQLLSRTLHAQAKLRLQQAFKLFGELAGVFGTEFAGFHDVSLSTDVTRHEGRANRQLGSGQAERFASKFLAHAFHFIQHLARLNFSNPKLRVTLTVTHTDFGGFLRNGLVGEHANPDAATPFDVTV